MRGFLILLAILLPLTSSADSALPFMKDLAGDAELPRPWGISIDFYTMEQDYDIEDLQFALSDVSLGDPSQIAVTNEVMHFDIKADVWLLPFLNVFGIVGRVDIDTMVDFSQADIVDLPFKLGTHPVNFKGTVYGLGFTLAYGNENWFTSATTTFTKTSIGGDLESAVDTFTFQPRIGLVRDNWLFWLGGMYLDADENHKGIFELPVVGDVPFSVDLATRDNWNYVVGTSYVFSDRTNLSFEIGVGNRTHTLFNFNVRF